MAERHEVVHEEYVEPTQASPTTAPVASEHIESTVVDSPATRHAQIYRAQQAVYLLFGVIEVLVAIRFLLRLFGADLTAPFSAAILGITAPFVAPFVGVFPNAAASGSVFEPASLLAIVIYALAAWLIAKIIWLLFARDSSAVSSSSVHRVR
jgi:hypothetical protein